MSSAVRATLRIVLALLVAIPVLAGCLWAVTTNATLAASWTPKGVDTEVGAPVAPGATGLDAQALTPAKRAVATAHTQAGFLTTATGELAAGTQQFADAAPELVTKTNEAADGAQALADGMVQLQNGTAELGRGATEVADGVGFAVDQVAQIPVIRDQMLAAIAEVDTLLADSKDPQIADARLKLIAARTELVNLQIPPEMLGKLGELKTGSRQVADQLNTPGQPYHDGIYTATKGAKELAAGLQSARGETSKLSDAVTKLDNGADRIAQMAKQNQDNVTAISRSLPGAPAAAAAAPNASSSTSKQSAAASSAPTTTATPGANATQQTSAAEQDTQSDAMQQRVLSPLVALLIAAIIMFAGAATWMIARPWHRLPMRKFFTSPQITAGVGMTVTTVVLLCIVAGFPGVLPALMMLVTIGLSYAAASGLARVAITALGANTGRIAIIVGMFTQVAVVSWAWKQAAHEELSTVATVLVHAMPLHYPTAALTAIGNGAPTAQITVALAVLTGTIVLCAIIGSLISSKLVGDNKELAAIAELDRLYGVSNPLERKHHEQQVAAIRDGGIDTGNVDDARPIAAELTTPVAPDTIVINDTVNDPETLPRDKA
ncbi:hypothetical protein ACFPVT_05065 [Corynebacterium choanae]|uniref:Chromosome partition protein Smc n=1 Tax=Corynebacterium choanae TaxID=1862358 RepID=A0A3G6J9W3_9CORY|nr:hypothetical protein [Corynebacterium choanae]AZA14582.1 hypothetical protein CCHOA_11025 [Corynebacterium choanae]